MKNSALSAHESLGRASIDRTPPFPPHRQEPLQLLAVCSMNFRLRFVATRYFRREVNLPASFKNRGQVDQCRASSCVIPPATLLSMCFTPALHHVATGGLFVGRPWQSTSARSTDSTPGRPTSTTMTTSRRSTPPHHESRMYKHR